MSPKDWMKPNFKKAVKLLPRNPVVVEVGSHKGDGVRYIKKKRNGAVIYAIEPCGDSFVKLKFFHDLSFHCAITDNCNYIALAHDGNTRQYRMNEHGREPIAQYTMDEFIDKHSIEKIDLIRFDCYGSEYRIFKTNNDFLNKVDMICITLQKQSACDYMNVECEREAIWEQLKSHRYKNILSQGKGADNHIYQLWQKKY